jgi:hypothetical protein
LGPGWEDPLGVIHIVSSLTDERPPAAPEPGGVPPELLAAARAAFAANQPRAGGPCSNDGALAVQVFDSLLDGSAGPDDHWLRFEHATLGVDVQVAHRTTSTEIRGELSPAGPIRAALHLEGASLAMPADIVDSRFSFNSVGHGLVRLSLESANAAPVVWTEWFQI